MNTLSDKTQHFSIRPFHMMAWSTYRYSTLFWVGIYVFWFNVLQLILGFYSPSLNNALAMHWT